MDPEGTLWFSNVTRDDESFDKDFRYACSATLPSKKEYKVGNFVDLRVLASGSSGGQNKHEVTKQYVTRRKTVAVRGQQAELWCIFGGT